jgi:hypothetical protein
MKILRGIDAVRFIAARENRMSRRAAVQLRVA